MNFLHSALSLTTDKLVEVTLAGSSANVMLVDDNNYNHYREGEATYHYYGGHYTKSPVHLRAPHAGIWHVVVDLGATTAGNVAASIAVVDKNAA